MSNVAVVEAVINALIFGDTGTALDHLDNDVHVSEPAGRSMGGEYIGKTAFVDLSGRSRRPTRSKSITAAYRIRRGGARCHRQQLD
jgi:hypothetical protein